MKEIILALIGAGLLSTYAGGTDPYAHCTSPADAVNTAQHENTSIEDLEDHTNDPIQTDCPLG